MAMLIRQHEKVQVDWLGLQVHTRTIGACVICFAIGGWVGRIDDRSADIPYEHRSTVQLQQVQKTVGKTDAVAAVNCLKKKAAVATTAAKQNAKAALTDADVPVIDPKVIPNCAPPVVAHK